MILPHLVTNLHALVSINTLVTRLVFISVSIKDVLYIQYTVNMNRKVIGIVEVF